MREPKDIIIKNKTLEQILTEHLHWFNKDCKGWENMRANLIGANLYGAILTGVILAGVQGANLDGAIF